MSYNTLNTQTESAAEGSQQISDLLLENGGSTPESLAVLGMKHSFTDGVYCREMTIPPETMVVGKIHKHKHHNFLVKGEILVATAEGGVQHLKAPMMIVSDPGTQRVGYALTETVWTCVHLNESNTQDLELLEKENVVDTMTDYLEYTENIKQIKN